MGKKIKEFITYWGTSLLDWNDNRLESRFVVERDEELLQQGAISGGRKMEKISINDIFQDGVVTGVDMENGYFPLAVYGNEDIIIEITNCDEEQGGWHRNMGADEWVFQYKGDRTIKCETGDIRINEGEMSVIPRGVAHQNVGHGSNIEITIYCRNALKQLASSDPEEARKAMKIKDSKPVEEPVTLDSAVN